MGRSRRTKADDRPNKLRCIRHLPKNLRHAHMQILEFALIRWMLYDTITLAVPSDLVAVEGSSYHRSDPKDDYELSSFGYNTQTPETSAINFENTER